MKETILSYAHLAKISILFLVTLLWTVPLHAQQEPIYSQYMFNMLNINPSYAGSRISNNITTLYRNQWVGLDGAPQTTTISWDARHTDSNIGYGLQMYFDKIGIEKTSGVKGFYSYYIPFENSLLSLGVSLGALNYQAGYTSLQEAGSGDPKLQEDINSWTPTAGFGFTYATESWYFGFSLPSLLRKNNTDASAYSSKNPCFISAGCSFNPGSDLAFKPSVLIKSSTGSPVQADLNMNIWFNNILGIGASYRTGDALVGLFELQILPQLRLGYAYDYTTSNLKSYNRGTHELMLRFEWGAEKSGKILSPRYY